MKNTPQQESQFIEAHKQYGDTLLHYCIFKISNREVAQDLVQETFFRAWRYMRQGKPVENIKAFLYKIAGNLIIDEYRSRDNDDSLERLHDEGFDPGFDDTDRWIDSIDGTQALGLLGEMRAPYKDMLFMRYIEGFSIHEIAEASEASENTVAVRIHRGLHILHDLYFLKTAVTTSLSS